MRGVIEFRDLNSITKTNSTKLPRNEKLFNCLEKEQGFFKMDLKMVPYQIRVRSKDIDKFTLKQVRVVQCAALSDS